jgi:hypothetical protein
LVQVVLLLVVALVQFPMLAVAVTKHQVVQAVVAVAVFLDLVVMVSEIQVQVAVLVETAVTAVQV